MCAVLYSSSRDSRIVSFPCKVDAQIDISRQEITLLDRGIEQTAIEVTVIADCLTERDMNIQAEGLRGHPPTRPPDQPSSLRPGFNLALARTDARAGNFGRGSFFQRRYF